MALITSTPVSKKLFSLPACTMLSMRKKLVEWDCSPIARPAGTEAGSVVTIRDLVTVLPPSTHIAAFRTACFTAKIHTTPETNTTNIGMPKKDDVCRKLVFTTPKITEQKDYLPHHQNQEEHIEDEFGSMFKKLSFSDNSNIGDSKPSRDMWGTPVGVRQQSCPAPAKSTGPSLKTLKYRKMFKRKTVPVTAPKIIAKITGKRRQLPTQVAV